MARYSTSAITSRKRKGLTRDDRPGGGHDDYTPATPYQKRLQRPIKKRAFRRKLRSLEGVGKKR